MTKFTCIPYLRKQNKKGFCPIHIRYYYQVQQAFPTGLMINPIFWDKGNNEVKPTFPDYIEYNRQINKVCNIIKDVAYSLPVPTYENVKVKYLEQLEKIKQAEIEADKLENKTKQSKRIKSLLKEYDLQDIESEILEYKATIFESQKIIEDSQTRINELLKMRKQYTDKGFIDHTNEESQFIKLLNKYPDKFIHSPRGTQYQIKTFVNFILEFNKETGTPLLFTHMDIDFYNSLVSYAIKKKFTNNTIGNRIKKLKMFLNWCIEYHNIEVNKLFKKFKVLQDEIEVIYINDEDLNLLWDYRNEVSDEDKKIIDVCVFQNLTGLRYSDVLNSDWIIDQGVLQGKTQKTKGNYLVPVEMDQRIIEILERYEYNLNIFNSDDFINKIRDIIKRLCEKQNIYQKKIKLIRYQADRKKENFKFIWEIYGTHSNRRSFVNRSLHQGYRETEILKFLGSKTNTELKKYINRDIDELLRSVRSKNGTDHH